MRGQFQFMKNPIKILLLIFAGEAIFLLPFELTGTAVGLISVIGYTPDIFIGPIMGYFLDGSPGIWGHQQLFIFLAIFAFMGSLATYRFKKTAVD